MISRQWDEAAVFLHKSSQSLTLQDASWVLHIVDYGLSGHRLRDFVKLCHVEPTKKHISKAYRLLYTGR